MIRQRTDIGVFSFWRLQGLGEEGRQQAEGCGRPEEQYLTEDVTINPQGFIGSFIIVGHGPCVSCDRARGCACPKAQVVNSGLYNLKLLMTLLYNLARAAHTITTLWITHVIIVTPLRNCTLILINLQWAWVCCRPITTLFYSIRFM